MKHTLTKKHNSLHKWPQVQPPTGFSTQIMAAVLSEPTPSWQANPTQAMRPAFNIALLTLVLVIANIFLAILAPPQLLQLRNILQNGLRFVDWGLQSAWTVWQGALALIEPYISVALLVMRSIVQPLAHVTLQLLTTNVANMPLVILPLIASLILVGQVFVLTSLWPSSSQDV